MTKSVFRLNNNKGMFIILVLLFLLTILFSEMAFAAIDVEVDKERKEIFPEEIVRFGITTTNTGVTDRKLYIEPNLDTKYNIQTAPVFHSSGFTIEPGQSANTTIIIKPGDKMGLGFHNLSFAVVDYENNRKYFGSLPFFIRDPSRFSDYVPIFNFNVDVSSSKLDPRESAEIEIRVSNQVNLDISDFTVELFSKINPYNNKKEVFNLKPLSRYDNLKFTLDYDDYQAPSEDEVIIRYSIPSKNRTYTEIVKKIEIVPFSNVVEKKEDTLESGLLKTVTVVELYNDGNAEAQYTYSEPTSIFKNFFTNVDPKGKEGYSDNIGKSIRWDVSIPPRESLQIKISVNYRPLFVIAILIIVAIVLYFVFRSPVLVHKNAHVVNKSSSGEISKVKVIVHVKNRTGNNVENVTIIDKIPTIAKLEDKFALGTLQPSKIIKHDKKGTMAKWQIAVLEPFEERIITYYISSTLNVIGGMTLKSTTVKFKGKTKRISKISSNEVKV